MAKKAGIPFTVRGGRMFRNGVDLGDISHEAEMIYRFGMAQPCPVCKAARGIECTLPPDSTRDEFWRSKFGYVPALARLHKERVKP